jgi:hypothetical protein
MKKILKIALLCLPLFFAAPKSDAQVRVDVNLGNPAIRPFPDAVWVPGYYYYSPVYQRRIYVEGRWRHDNGLHRGWYKGNGNPHGNGRGKGRGHEKD